jgi:hypothetical protein
LVFHVEVNFSGFPFVASFAQERGDQTQEGFFVGKDPGDVKGSPIRAGSSHYLHFSFFPIPMGGQQIEDITPTPHL